MIIKGFLIRKIPLEENDLLLEFLTPQFGFLNFFYNNGQHKKQQLQYLDLVEFLVPNYISPFLDLLPKIKQPVIEASYYLQLTKNYKLYFQTKFILLIWKHFFPEKSQVKNEFFLLKNLLEEKKENKFNILKKIIYQLGFIPDYFLEMEEKKFYFKIIDFLHYHHTLNLTFLKKFIPN